MCSPRGVYEQRRVFRRSLFRCVRTSRMSCGNSRHIRNCRTAHRALPGYRHRRGYDTLHFAGSPDLSGQLCSWWSDQRTNRLPGTDKRGQEPQRNGAPRPPGARRRLPGEVRIVGRARHPWPGPGPARFSRFACEPAAEPDREPESGSQDRAAAPALFSRDSAMRIVTAVTRPMTPASAGKRTSLTRHPD